MLSWAIRRAMDQYKQVELLRSQAHECRMRAAMTTEHEAKQGWLDLAREYERQADHIEAAQPDADHT